MHIAYQNIRGIQIHRELDSACPIRLLLLLVAKQEKKTSAVRFEDENWNQQARCRFVKVKKMKKEKMN